MKAFAFATRTRIVKFLELRDDLIFLLIFCVFFMHVPSFQTLHTLSIKLHIEVFSIKNQVTAFPNFLRQLWLHKFPLNRSKTSAFTF